MLVVVGREIAKDEMGEGWGGSQEEVVVVVVIGGEVKDALAGKERTKQKRAFFSFSLFLSRRPILPPSLVSVELMIPLMMMMPLRKAVASSFPNVTSFLASSILENE